jgi:hypothetical protein
MFCAEPTSPACTAACIILATPCRTCPDWIMSVPDTVVHPFPNTLLSGRSKPSTMLPAPAGATPQAMFE